MDTSMLIGLLLALLILLYFITRLFLKSRSTAGLIINGKSSVKSTHPRFLLVGPPQSGKTSIYAQLRYSNDAVDDVKKNSSSTRIATLPSWDVNRSSIALPSTASSTVELVDIPGHPKLLRHLIQQEFQSSHRSSSSSRIAGILFLINSTSTVFLKQYRDIAEDLYWLLSRRVGDRRPVPVLICCHFQDKAPMAFGGERVRDMLEMEMDKVRQSRCGDLMQGVAGAGDADHGDGESGWPFLGYDDKPFAFDDVENEVTFVESQLSNLESILSWMEDHLIAS